MPIFNKLVDSHQLPAHTRQIPISSPLSGKVVLLDQVPDPLFQQRLFGEGVAIEVSGYQLLAPFKAKIERFEATRHQIRLKAANGLRVLIQLGVGSEQLMGEGFKSSIKVGQVVEKGTPLVEFDLRKLKAKLASTLCPITVLNSDKTKGILPHTHSVRALEDNAMTILL